MPPRKSVEEKLNDLDALPEEPDRPARIKAALADRHYRVVAKAARLSAEGLQYELLPHLLAAYQRFLKNPTKADPNCLAKRALARALVELDSDDTAFFLDGLRYRQPEPVWGGSMDTAVDVRCSCAMGLVATGYSRALVELTELLNDPEADARAGAARAIACGNPREAELLLRSKVLFGDAEPGVIGECFTGLLTVEPDESVAFVARYLSDQDEAIRELAALALGESRLEPALSYLKTAWHDVLPPAGFRRVLIRAAVVHRSETAFDWLISMVEHSEASVAEQVVEALSIYKHNSKMAERLKGILAQRGDRALQEKFAKVWKPAVPDKR